jgi:hypothetical protein
MRFAMSSGVIASAGDFASACPIARMRAAAVFTSCCSWPNVSV